MLIIDSKEADSIDKLLKKYKKKMVLVLVLNDFHHFTKHITKCLNFIYRFMFI